MKEDMPSRWSWNSPTQEHLTTQNVSSTKRTQSVGGVWKVLIAVFSMYAIKLLVTTKEMQDPTVALKSCLYKVFLNENAVKLNTILNKAWYPVQLIWYICVNYDLFTANKK